MKKRVYGQRMQEIEHASFSSFTPVVTSATSGLAHEATYFYKHLASVLSHKGEGQVFSCNGLVAVFLVIFFIMFC